MQAAYIFALLANFAHPEAMAFASRRSLLQYVYAQSIMAPNFDSRSESLRDLVDNFNLVCETGEMCQPGPSHSFLLRLRN